MAEKIEAQAGQQKARMTWNGVALTEAVKKEAVKRLYLAAEMVKGQIQRNLSTSSRSSGPSKPGEYPHANTGRLRNSIFWEVNEDAIEAIIGTPLKYGLYLEYGTAGGQVVHAKAGGVLSWVNSAGVRCFARSVKIGPIRGRSYLRRTLVEMEPKIRALFTKAFGGGTLKVS